MGNIEAIRTKFRPRRIKTLFVGESAPRSGKFFYHGNSGMLRHMKEAVESVLGESDNFLGAFKKYGWYLDDLVLTPVNHLTTPARRTKCRKAQEDLAARIAKYRPEAIVCLLSRIEKFVKTAKDASGSTASFYSVPFPGMGHQKRFRQKMRKILPKLPRL